MERAEDVGEGRKVEGQASVMPQWTEKWVCACFRRWPKRVCVEGAGKLLEMTVKLLHIFHFEYC